jgi:predicted signal transduction protein with EAL and GGDEF domain
LDYAEATEGALGHVRSLGVAMQLDDFGTGKRALEVRFDVLSSPTSIFLAKVRATKPADDEHS